MEPKTGPITGDDRKFPTGAAFPVAHGDHEPGLTKREWFAGLAMQALIQKGFDCDLAKEAVGHADQLLIELSQ